MRGRLRLDLTTASSSPCAADSVHLTEPGGERMARQIAFELGPKLLDIRRQNAK